MQRYQDVVLDQYGNPVPGVLVTVTTYPGGVATTLYSDNGVTPLPTNSVTTNALGTFWFYAADGHYTLTFTGTNMPTTVVNDVLLEDTGDGGSPGAFTTMTLSGQLTSNVAPGTAPFVISSPTQVLNLNASQLEGKTWEVPGTIGSTTPNSGAFTTLSATSTVSGAGITALFASPPAIGSTTPSSGSFTGLTDSGNLTFTGTGNRITGNFSDATMANRAMFQTSTVNGNTMVAALPNGTSVTSNFTAFSASDPTNAPFGQLSVNGSVVSLTSGALGSGTALPLTVSTSGTVKLTIAADTTGTYTFGGTAPRITGDFSNATTANRVMFQSSTTNGNTLVAAIPNGTATISALQAFNNSTLSSATGQFQFTALSTECQINANSPAGSYLPLTVYTSGTEKLRIAADTTGTYTFGGTAPRITGDMSNITTTGVAFQTNVVNGISEMLVMPNGTGVTSGYSAINSSVFTNCAFVDLIINNTNARLRSAIVGSGTYVPISIQTGGGEALLIDTSKNVLVTGSGGLGYGTGSGGTVTQLTDKTTGVTLNKPSGAITMNNAALAANTTVKFVLTNSSASNTDGIVWTIKDGSVTDVANYNVWSSVGAGAHVVCVRNISAGSLSEAIVLNFQVHRGATA